MTRPRPRSTVTQSTYARTPAGQLYTWSTSLTQGTQTFCVVFLHGAGSEGATNFRTLAEDFADFGGHSVGLDFLGHGKSDGLMSDSSLRIRGEQARCIIDSFCAPNLPLLICGFSMGAHTALQVSARLGQRVRGLWLLAPACYAPEAESCPFGPEFTAVLRRKDSWRSSPAFADAASFRGTAVITTGSLDETVPWGVIEQLVRSFRERSQILQLDILRNVGHNVLAEINDRKQFRLQVVESLALQV
ncbi:alpha/beta fold hydrolase [Micromonospora ureilytica]|uniref:alpha/beta hydrolase n=1 Tax=Micromonospora ureilytica TaxID=709868 RepID=UPI0033DB7E47